MYTSFYGLSEKPFSLTPDPRYLFLSAPHREALAHVLYGIEQGEGFIAITGEVGTGKTTLCRTLLQRLEKDTEIAFLFNPTLSGKALVRAISQEFGLDTRGKTRSDLTDQLYEFLLETNRKGRRVLLIIDEAQNLEANTLEEIRLFSNLETTTSKLLQILLFGQPELDEKLESHELRQLRQRISVRWKLRPMTLEETLEYVRHRLAVASGSDREIFTERALREVQRRSRGIPRLINLLCDRALLSGFAAGCAQIGHAEVSAAAKEILGDRRRRRFLRWFGFNRVTASAALVLALGAGAVAIYAASQKGLAHSLHWTGSRDSELAVPSASPVSALADSGERR
jgi:general secretion pathway protein A